MKIEILNSITHDGVVFGRGIYEVGQEINEELARMFVELDARGERKGYAAQSVESASNKGVISPAADAKPHKPAKAGN